MWILIPAYEPRNKLLELVAEINIKTNYSILIIDDGSGPAYKEIFQKAELNGCTVLTHKINEGKGNALKTGFSYLMSQGNIDGVVCADCDGQHHIEDIIKVADAVFASTAKMVLGIRKFDGKVPFKSRFGNSITALVFGASTGKWISDTQTGLRGYPSSMLPWLCDVPGSRFEYELNLLLQATDEKFAIKEIPILTIYDNQNRSTHFRPIADSVRVYLPILKFSGSSFISAILDFALLFAFNALTGSLFWGVVMARIISSVFNYSVNKHLVFNAKHTHAMKSAPKYFGLVSVMMILNYFIISLLSNVLHIPGIISKLLTELILFAFSFVMQRRFVFKKYTPVSVRN